MQLKRALLAMLLMFGALAGSFATVSAAGSPAAAPAPVVFQDDDDDDATQEADDQADDSDDNADDSTSSGSGDTIQIFDERGDAILEITVEETFLPWEDFSEYSTPDRGYDFVAMHVTVANISDDEQEVSDFDFMIRDEFGFLYGTTFASIEEGSASEDIGELEGDDIDAGDSITGLIIFAVPTDSELVDVFYAPYGRLITIATLS